MSLTGLLTAAIGDAGRAGDPALLRLLESVDAPSLTITAAPGFAPLAIAALADRGARTVLAVTSTGREADDLAAALRCLLRPDSVAVYPGWETLPHERLSPGADTVGQRLAVLRRLAHPSEPSANDPATGPLSVVVAPIRSVLQPQVPGLGELTPVELHVGDTARDFATIVYDLVMAGYARVELVERRGQFAVRGGILDVFPPTEQHPLRIEFWGEDVEEIRYFKVADQRSLDVAPHGLWAPPCRELLLTPEVQERAAKLAAEHPELAEMLDPISRGEAIEGMEALAPVLVDDLRLMLHELPAGSHVVVCGPERVRTRAAELVRTSAEFLDASWAAAASGGRAPIDLGAASLWELPDVIADAASIGLPWWSISPFGVDPDGGDTDTVVSAFEPAPMYHGDTDAALHDLRGWMRAGWQAVLVFEGHGSAERAVERLAQVDIAARFVTDVTPLSRVWSR